MTGLNSQAIELNRTIENLSPAVFGLLSKKGRAIYYPSRGILAQGAAARNKEINATIGTAYEDDGRAMVIPSLMRGLNVPPDLAFPYAPSEGLKMLREKWQELITVKNPGLGAAEISLPVITSGVTHGLSLIGYLFVEEGEDILLSDLYWENYDLVFGNAFGAELKYFRLFDKDEFDLAAFRQALGLGPVGKKIVLLNFPNNPSGYSPTQKAAAGIVRILKESAAQGNRLAVILDDSYFGLVFEDDVFRQSLFAKLAQAHENLLAIKADGITKEEFAWGLRIGFLTYGIKNGTRALYKALEDKTVGAVRGSISNACHASQSIFLEALKSPEYSREKKRNQEVIQTRYRKVKEVLAAHPEYQSYFQSLPFNSGYFMCLKIENADSDKVWEQLLNHYSTGVISYSEKSLFRIAFASTPLGKIEKMFNNIYLACQDCSNK